MQKQILLRVIDIYLVLDFFTCEEIETRIADISDNSVKLPNQNQSNPILGSPIHPPPHEPNAVTGQEQNNNLDGQNDQGDNIDPAGNDGQSLGSNAGSDSNNSNQGGVSGNDSSGQTATGPDGDDGNKSTPPKVIASSTSSIPGKPAYTTPVFDPDVPLTLDVALLITEINGEKVETRWDEEDTGKVLEISSKLIGPVCQSQFNS